MRKDINLLQPSAIDEGKVWVNLYLYMLKFWRKKIQNLAVQYYLS